MVAPKLVTAPSLPCLKTDLCPDRSLEAETAGLKMVKELTRVNIQTISFCIWDALHIAAASSGWSYYQPPLCFDKLLRKEREVPIGRLLWRGNDHTGSKGWNLRFGSGQTTIMGGGNGSVLGSLLLGDPVFSLWGQVTSFPFKRDSPSSHNPATTWHNSSESSLKIK